jgi:hypothetical protein
MPIGCGWPKPVRNQPVYTICKFGKDDTEGQSDHVVCITKKAGLSMKPGLGLQGKI